MAQKRHAGSCHDHNNQVEFQREICNRVKGMTHCWIVGDGVEGGRRVHFEDGGHSGVRCVEGPGGAGGDRPRAPLQGGV